MPRSPLFSKLESSQARWMIHHEWEIPASFGSAESEYWMLKKEAGLLDLTYRGRILVRGQDAPRFLHGMVTSDVLGLKTGQGNTAFLLDVHGHILADLRILRLEPESFLVDCEPQSSAVVIQALDRHIIADVVELEDLRNQQACLAVEGPDAHAVLQQALGLDLPAMKILDHFYSSDLSTRIVRTSVSGEDGYWMISSPDRAAELWDKIVKSGENVNPVSFEALEVCRIEAGIPRYGADITEKNLPQETGQMQAVSFTKGCYVGQEVVERVRSRGHVNRMLVRLLFDGRQEVPPQTEIFFEGQSVGATASSAYCFGLERTVAFGYLRREVADPGNKVKVGAVTAEVAEL